MYRYCTQDLWVIEEVIYIYIERELFYNSKER